LQKLATDVRLGWPMDDKCKETIVGTRGIVNKLQDRRLNTARIYCGLYAVVCVLWSKSERAVVALGRGEELKTNGCGMPNEENEKINGGFLQILPCPHLTLNHTWTAVHISVIEVGDSVWTGMTH